MPELRPPLKELLRTQPSASDTSRMWANIRARRERAGFGRWQLASLATASVIGVLAFGVYLGTFGTDQAPATASTQPPAPARATETGPLRLQDGSVITALRTDDRATELTLGDGSRITLDAKSELLPRGSTASRVSFELTHGRVTLDVVPGGPRRWSVTAGDVQVSVLGTRFSVERSDLAVSVRVDRGHVRVHGARLPGGTRELYAGQDVLVPEVTAAPPTVTAVADAGAAPERSATTRRSAASAQGLLTQADRARLAGKPEDAAVALQRLLDQHGDDPSAALAALTLGRLYLDQLSRPALAARALQRASDLGLPQALTEEGAARLVEAHAKAGHTDLARAAATRYRAQHAGGRRSADVERWSQGE